MKNVTECNTVKLSSMPLPAGAGPEARIKVKTIQPKQINNG